MGCKLLDPNYKEDEVTRGSSNIASASSGPVKLYKNNGNNNINIINNNSNDLLSQLNTEKNKMKSLTEQLNDEKK